MLELSTPRVSWNNAFCYKVLAGTTRHFLRNKKSVTVFSLWKMAQDELKLPRDGHLKSECIFPAIKKHINASFSAMPFKKINESKINLASNLKIEPKLQTQSCQFWS